MRTMGRPLRAILLLFGLAVLVPAVTAEDLESELPALRKATALELDVLAAWCNKKQLYAKRDEVFEQLLEYDPEHEDARRRLRYQKDERGTWEQDVKYKRPRNLAKGAEEADERLAVVLGRYRAAVLALCAKAQTIPELLWARRLVDAMASRCPEERGIDPVLRDLTLRYYASVRDKGLIQEMDEAGAWLTQHHPEDLAIRAAMRETKREDTWVLDETARALDHLMDFATFAAETMKAIAPRKAELPKHAAKIELPWTDGAATEHVQAFGTVAPAQLADLVTACEAAGPMFERALGAAPVRREELTLYVFATKGECKTFLSKYPVVDNPTLQIQDKLDLVYASGRTLAIKANPADAQKDLAVNELLNQMISDTFLESAAPRGWHAEGLSRYLAWRIAGTRLSINVSGKYAGQAGDREVPGTDDSWLSSARAQLKANPAADLELMMGKGTDVFSPRDALVAYAFAVYLLEGFDRLAGEFLKAHQATKDADKACRSILGMPRAVAEHRLLRWLDDMLAHQAVK